MSENDEHDPLPIETSVPKYGGIFWESRPNDDWKERCGNALDPWLSVTIALYPSARAVFCAMFELDQSDLDDVTMQEEGGEPKCALDAIADIEAMGIWSWNDPERGEIHMWHDGLQATQTLIHVFGHELGSVAIDVDCPDDPERMSEEALQFAHDNEVDKFGMVAARAYELATEAEQRAALAPWAVTH